MTTDTRNTRTTRPDAALRWAGRIVFVTAIVVITDLALQPGYVTPPRLFGSDKLEHFAAFAGLMVVARIGWPRRMWSAALALFLYGLAIELLQALPAIGRTASIADLAADTVGIAAGAGAAWLATKALR